MPLFGSVETRSAVAIEPPPANSSNDQSSASAPLPDSKPPLAARLLPVEEDAVTGFPSAMFTTSFVTSIAT